MAETQDAAGDSPGDDLLRAGLFNVLRAVAGADVRMSPAHADLRPRIDDIMDLFRRALETPGMSPAIDTHFVRAMMGKVGSRTIAKLESAEQVIGFAPDPAIEIFCRCYEAERTIGTIPAEAASYAQHASRTFKPMMAIHIPGTPVGA